MTFERISKNVSYGKIAKMLNDQGLTTVRGKSYNPRIVGFIMRGEQEDETAEPAIWEFYQDLQKNKARMESIRNNLMESTTKDIEVNDPEAINPNPGGINFTPLD